MVLSSSGSMVHPQMILAPGLTLLVTISAALCASSTVMSGPPTTRTMAPLASLQVHLAQQGEFRASCTAASTRSSSASDSPIPTKATPPSFIMVWMSA